LHHPAGRRITVFPRLCGPPANATFVSIVKVKTLFGFISAIYDFWLERGPFTLSKIGA
jgi:hypothetical protein